MKTNINYNSSDKKYKVGKNWWFDLKCEFSYKIFDSHSLYPTEYFSRGHPTHEDFIALSDIIVKKASSYKDIDTILDFGCSRGLMVKTLNELGYDCYGIDATQHKNMIPEYLDKIFNSTDFRDEFDLNRKFDLIICMEVAEHIECPFSSVLVKNITKHSDLIYFSACPPDTNKPHIHHPNEQPMEFWVNLFKYYDFELLTPINNLSNRREDGVFFKKI